MRNLTEHKYFFITIILAVFFLVKCTSFGKVSYQNVELGEAGRYIGNLAYPLGKEGRISSPYGDRHGHRHKGIDYSAKLGTPIYAAHDGKVVASGRPWSGYGNVVAIDSHHGLLTLYAHCNRLFVRAGQSVKRGQLIAEVGATGRTTGPHLHFETRLLSKKGYDRVVDPALFY